MNLFLVAVLPPESVLSQAWALKQEIHRRTGSRNAVRLPPHITLLPPTRQPAGFEAACRKVLREFAAVQLPFAIGLQDFDWFGARTLFIRVTEAGSLRALHVALLAEVAAFLPTVTPEARPFTPHLTLATRDLPAALVPGLRREFAARTFTASFEVGRLTLFRHDGRQWVPVEDFTLGPTG